MNEPSTRLTALLIGFGLTAWFGLYATMPALPDDSSLAAMARWWDTVGTPSASMTLVHLSATALASWLTVSGAIGLIASVRSSRTTAMLWRLVCTPGLRRLLGGTVLVASTGAPQIAVAEDTEPADTGPDIILEDRGPMTDDPIVLTDIGPGPVVAPGYPGPAPTTPASDPVIDTWTIERGDHLWRIAEETLRDRDHEADVSLVTEYWIRLIEANPDVVGDNPDLVYPGQIVRLPD